MLSDNNIESFYIICTLICTGIVFIILLIRTVIVFFNPKSETEEVAESIFELIGGTLITALFGSVIVGIGILISPFLLLIGLRHIFIQKLLKKT